MKIQTYEPQFTILPADYYETVIKEVKEVPNSFYDESKPKEGYPTQIEIDFEIKNPEEGSDPIIVKKWFSPTLSPRAFLTGLMKSIDPKFDPTSGELDTDQIMGKKVRVNVIQKEDKTGIIRNRIDGITESKIKE